EPVTSAFFPSSLKLSRIIFSVFNELFLSASRLQTGTPLVKPRLHVHHAKLAVLDFAMCSHRPEEADSVSGHGNIRMVAARHQDRIALPYHRHQFGIFSVVIYELNTARGIWHIELHVPSLQHCRVLMARPTGPI